MFPDDPVDNINQPALAAALTESLQLAGKLPETALTPINYGICATINGKFAVKAPDWAFIYEQILQVPSYGIFDPDRGVLELYRLDNQQKYR